MAFEALSRKIKHEVALTFHYPIREKYVSKKKINPNTYNSSNSANSGAHAPKKPSHKSKSN